MNVLQSLLALLVKSIIAKYQPFIIAVTGSVGKTSAKEAIFAVVAKKKRTRTAQKNYNNQLGVPFTIIGVDAPGKNPFAWLLIFLRAAWLLVVRDRTYPECLALEFGADRPGDIEYLMKLAPPKIGVLTAVAPAHTEFFGSLEAVAKEKSTIISGLPAGGIAVLNADDPHVLEARNVALGKVVTFGFEAGSEVHGVSAISFLEWETLTGGVEITVNIQGEVDTLVVEAAFGKHSAYAPLAALAVGQALGYTLDECVAALADYHPPKGRMHLIPGVKQTVIIDDTYNSSPEAAKRALETLAELKPKAEENMRVAILGDMAELGSYTEDAHRAVGLLANDLALDLLVCVGEKSRDTARAAREACASSENIFEFADPTEAARFVQNKITPGDLILIKGSQSARMEFAVKELMAEPLRAAELLVRQDPSWKI